MYDISNLRVKEARMSVGEDPRSGRIPTSTKDKKRVEE